ncbi:hypothetical protein DUI87_29743 [Hirundo rustica rustica]|uniref:Large ribosomal subunit protein uL4m n=1 Tax=Hirundo rustica rustica TaxID=333673 RepID=A0A3M0IWV3_HIRRU|nr:hypothetical protein DUI87_29743 [Hirundo rustica rustica]
MATWRSMAMASRLKTEAASVAKAVPSRTNHCTGVRLKVVLPDSSVLAMKAAPASRSEAARLPMKMYMARIPSRFWGDPEDPQTLDPPRIPSRFREPSPSPSPVLRRCSVPVPPPQRPLQAWVGSLRHPGDALRGLAELPPRRLRRHAQCPPNVPNVPDVPYIPNVPDVPSVPDVPYIPNVPDVPVSPMSPRCPQRPPRCPQSHARVLTRAEVRGGGRKPWRQKGSGRARHGSIRSPLWRGGGIAHGPRGPTSYFYMVPMRLRVLGLKVALSVKLMQDELHVVDNLEVPSSDPRYLQDLARFRHWGSSVLLVDVDEFPEDISAAAEELKSVTLLPALGLNVHSLLKHQTLVLTLGAVTFLERRLLWHDRRYSALYPFCLPYRDLPWEPRDGI